MCVTIMFSLNACVPFGETRLRGFNTKANDLFLTNLLIVFLYKGLKPPRVNRISSFITMPHIPFILLSSIVNINFNVMGNNAIY